MASIPSIGADDTGPGNSSRRSWLSSSFRDPSDVFRKNAGAAEDEEENLKWAALEKLPTYNRMRKGMLPKLDDAGNVINSEVNLLKLDTKERKILVERIMRNVEDDNEMFLKRLRDRFNQVGVDLPKIEVRFQNLSVESISNVGSRVLPNLLNATINTLRGLFGFLQFSRQKKKVIKILDDVSGTLKPSRMTLLLGPPGSGKTTLLLALAGKLDKNLRCPAGSHIVAMSFLNFFHRELVPTSVRMTIILVLGLDICSDTTVGDEMRRGISGGQKKRVTTGEMLVGPAKALFMDEISTGLDSSTTFQIVKFIKQMVAEDLRIPFDKSLAHPDALAMDKYGMPNWELCKACFSREWLLMKHNSFIFIFKITQLTIMAVIALTLFPRTNMHHDSIGDGGKYYGALFNSLVNMMFNGMSELILTVLRLPVFYKQRDCLFYAPWSFGLSYAILKIPLSVLESGIWIVITYYGVGFAPVASRFFRQFLAYIFIHQMSLGLFRLIAAVGRTMVIANTFGILAVLVVFVLGGFVVSKDDIQPWWIWAYWLSPMMYGQNAIAVNEFLDPRWNKRNNDSSLNQSTIGKAILKSRGMFVNSYWYWISVGALIGFAFLFNICFILALTYLNPIVDSRAVIVNDDQESENKNQARKIKQVSRLAKKLKKFDEPIDTGLHSSKEMKRNGVQEKRLQLLCNASGAFRPGILTALVGVSGAGKTTLMDVLAGRKTGGYIDGNISICGYPKKQETFARISGYCEQNDIHSPHVTVLESLTYSAWLRLSSEIDLETRKIQSSASSNRAWIPCAPRVNPCVALVEDGVFRTRRTLAEKVPWSTRYASRINVAVDAKASQKKLCRRTSRGSGVAIRQFAALGNRAIGFTHGQKFLRRVEGQMFVGEIMDLIELNPLRNVLVGLPGIDGLSTEQRKRLTIAVELVANPSIVFMDEPTSGLDARAAAIVMRTVRNTVNTGRTVVCTIHQPSIDIFETFDELLLMKLGGQVIYAGELGHHSSKLVDYFEVSFHF
ncbi:Pleiotropic drug resistance protein 2 [Platanthera guangdongensis]|uniref:Pleiotropic drug resistance protein 2 n=1 Tax=Platanthera guangdongensis TaxID=2320717 RepID=A0ABR2N445_9ASPA